MLIIISLLFVSCNDNSNEKVIGVILSSSGKADFIGKPEKAILEILENDYNESDSNINKVRLEIVDSNGSLEKALSLFNNFSKRDDVIAIIGPSTSGESIGVASKAREQKIPLLSLAASSKIVLNEDGSTNPWVFKFAQNDNLAADKVLRSIKRSGFSNIAILSSDDGFGKSGEAELTSIIESTNLNVLYKGRYPSSLDNPEPYAANVVKNDSVDAVIIWGTAPGPALLVQSLSRNNYKGKVYFSHANASESFLMSAGTASEGCIILGSRVLLNEDDLDGNEVSDLVLTHFKDLWSYNFDDSPSQFGGYARDAYVSLIEILDEENLEGDISEIRQNVRNRLEQLTRFYGVTGTYSFSRDNHTGLGLDAFVIYEVKDGEFVPHNESFGY